MSSVAAGAAPRRNLHLTPITLALALIAIAVAPLALKNYGIYLLTLWCVYVMAGMGLNLTVGYAGQMSIGQAAFFIFSLSMLVYSLYLQKQMPQNCTRKISSPCECITT